MYEIKGVSADWIFYRNLMEPTSYYIIFVDWDITIDFHCSLLFIFDVCSFVHRCFYCDAFVLFGEKQLSKLAQIFGNISSVLIRSQFVVFFFSSNLVIENGFGWLNKNKSKFFLMDIYRILDITLQSFENE